jgi:hypothetical protein
LNQLKANYPFSLQACKIPSETIDNRVIWLLQLFTIVQNSVKINGQLAGQLERITVYLEY